MAAITNADRAERARSALSQAPYDGTVGQNIRDMLADLLHLAREEGIDPDKIHTSSKINFDSEESEENQDGEG